MSSPPQEKPINAWIKEKLFASCSKLLWVISAFSAPSLPACGLRTSAFMERNISEFLVMLVGFISDRFSRERKKDVVSWFLTLHITQLFITFCFLYYPQSLNLPLEHLQLLWDRKTRTLRSFDLLKLKSEIGLSRWMNGSIWKSMSIEVGSLARIWWLWQAVLGQWERPGCGATHSLKAGGW